MGTPEITREPKYIAKSFFFWMVRFLQLKYQKVDMVFIAHDTEVQVVPGQDFFALSQGGDALFVRLSARAGAYATASPG